MEFNFSENLVVDSLEKVPGDFRGLYKEADGKFKLAGDDPAVGSAVKAIVGLNRALVASRAEAKDAKGKTIDLTPLADYGDTPEKIAEGVRARIEEATKTAKGKVGEDAAVQIKAAQEAMAAAHAKELTKHTERNGALTGQLYKMMVNAEGTAALATANALNPALVMPFIERQVKVVEENGQLAVRVINAKGEDRFSGTTGNHMTIKELVDEMRSDEQYQPLFKSDAASGGGRGTTHVPGRGPTGGTERTSIQKISAGLSKK